MNQKSHDFPPQFEEVLQRFLQTLTQSYGEKYKGTPGGLQKNWEAYHLIDYMQHVSNGKKEYLNRILNRCGLRSYEELRKLSNTKGFSYKQKKGLSLLKCLAEFQEISLLQCFADLLEYCWKNSLPLFSTVI